MTSSLPTSVLVALLTCVISCNMFAHAIPVSNQPDEFYVAFPKVLHSGGSTTVWIHHKSKSSSVNDYLFTGTIKVLQPFTGIIFEIIPFSLQRDSTKKLQVSTLCSHSTHVKVDVFFQMSLPDGMDSYIKVHVQINHPIKGTVFSQNTSVTTQPVERLVYIETDKPMYKPGDRVRFRIVSVRMDTLTESSEVRGTARGVDAPVYYSRIVVRKPNLRAVATWININWQQGFEVSSS